MRQNAPQATLRGAWVGVKKPKALDLGEVLESLGGDVDGLLASDVQTREALAADAKPNLPNAVHGLLERLRRGDFGARSTSCRHCELGAVCRVSARRLVEEGAGP
jgi:hypothetical protein